MWIVFIMCLCNPILYVWLNWINVLVNKFLFILFLRNEQDITCSNYGAIILGLTMYYTSGIVLHFPLEYQGAM